MSGKPKYTTKDVIDALVETKGMVYLAADRLGCSHMTVYRYIDRHPTVKAEFDKQRGLLLDAAELRLGKAIFESEPWAIRFALTMLGHERGYVPKQAVEQSGDLSIKLKWGDDAEPDD